jgi:hypothetical protein
MFFGKNIPCTVSSKFISYLIIRWLEATGVTGHCLSYARLYYMSHGRFSKASLPQPPLEPGILSAFPCHICSSLLNTQITHSSMSIFNIWSRFASFHCSCHFFSWGLMTMVCIWWRMNKRNRHWIDNDINMFYLYCCHCAIPRAAV